MQQRHEDDDKRASYRERALQSTDSLAKESSRQLGSGEHRRGHGWTWVHSNYVSHAPSRLRGRVACESRLADLPRLEASSSDLYSFLVVTCMCVCL